MSHDVEKIEEKVIFSIFKETYIKGISDTTYANSTQEVSSDEIIFTNYWKNASWDILYL